MKRCRRFFDESSDLPWLGCRDVIERVDAYLDRELQLQMAVLIEEHLSRCEVCRVATERRWLLKRRLQMTVSSVDVPAHLLWSLRTALAGSRERN